MGEDSGIGNLLGEVRRGGPCRWLAEEGAKQGHSRSSLNLVSWCWALAPRQAVVQCVALACPSLLSFSIC